MALGASGMLPPTGGTARCQGPWYREAPGSAAPASVSQRRRVWKRWISIRPTPELPGRSDAVARPPCRYAADQAGNAPRFVLRCSGLSARSVTGRAASSTSAPADEQLSLRICITARWVAAGTGGPANGADSSTRRGTCGAGTPGMSEMAASRPSAIDEPATRVVDAAWWRPASSICNTHSRRSSSNRHSDIGGIILRTRTATPIASADAQFRRKAIGTIGRGRASPSTEC